MGQYEYGENAAATATDAISSHQFEWDGPRYRLRKITEWTKNGAFDTDQFLQNAQEALGLNSIEETEQFFADRGIDIRNPANKGLSQKLSAIIDERPELQGAFTASIDDMTNSALNQGDRLYYVRPDMVTGEDGKPVRGDVQGSRVMVVNNDLGVAVIVNGDSPGHNTVLTFPPGEGEAFLQQQIQNDFAGYPGFDPAHPENTTQVGRLNGDQPIFPAINDSIDNLPHSGRPPVTPAVVSPAPDTGPPVDHNGGGNASLKIEADNLPDAPDSNLFDKVGRKLGAIAGIGVGAYYLIKGDYAQAAAAALPGAGSAMEAWDGRPTEAVMQLVEETGVGSLLTEAGRPALQAMGFDVDDGLIQSALTQDMDSGMLGMQAAYMAAHHAYGDLGTLEGQAKYREAANRLVEMENIEDPQAKFDAVNDFLNDARTELELEMSEFVNENMQDLPLEELGLEVGPDGMPLDMESAQETVLTALMDPNKFSELGLHANGPMREQLYEFQDMKDSWSQINQHQAILHMQAAEEGLEITPDNTAPEETPRALPEQDTLKASFTGVADPDSVDPAPDQEASLQPEHAAPSETAPEVIKPRTHDAAIVSA